MPKPLTVWITTNWKILQEMQIWDHLTCLLRNLYADQEATIRNRYGTTGKESESAQSCPTLCDPMDCVLPGFSVHGFFQAMVLNWVAISFSKGSSRPRNRTRVSHIAGRSFTIWPTREAWNNRQVPNGKGISQSCMFSPCLFNLYAKYIRELWNAWMDEAHAGIKIVGRNINSLRNADDTTLIAESEDELTAS